MMSERVCSYEAGKVSVKSYLSEHDNVPNVFTVGNVLR